MRKGIALRRQSLRIRPTFYVVQPGTANAMDVFTLDAEFLAGYREKIKNDIAYARYRVGDSWYRGEIQKAEVLDGGVVEAAFLIDHTVSGNITVTAVELYNHQEKRIGGKKTSITRADATEGILYVCRFRLFQIVESKNGDYMAL